MDMLNSLPSPKSNKFFMMNFNQWLDAKELFFGNTKQLDA